MPRWRNNRQGRQYRKSTDAATPVIPVMMVILHQSSLGRSGKINMVHWLLILKQVALVHQKMRTAFRLLVEMPCSAVGREIAR